MTTRPDVECLDRLFRRLHVGRLRIVDEPHTTNDRDRLQRVLETRERFNGPHNRVVRDAGNLRYRRSRHHIRNEVPAD